MALAGPGLIGRAAGRISRGSRAKILRLSASGGVCTDQDVTIYLDIRLDASDTNPSDGTDYSFCETSGLGPLCIEEPPGTFKFSGSGTLCGNLFTWNAVSPGYFAEVGVWDFASEGDTFIKSSAYETIGGGGVGICAGSGRRGGDADPPRAIGACPAGTD